MGVFTDIIKKAQQFVELGRQVKQTGEAQLTASVLESKLAKQQANKPMSFPIGEGLTTTQTKLAEQKIATQPELPEKFTVFQKPRVNGLDPDIFITDRIKELSAQGLSIRDAEIQSMGEASRFASSNSGTVWIFNKKKTKSGGITFEPTGVDIISSIQPLKNVAKGGLKNVEKKAVSVIDDAISKAKASGQSFDEWVKGQGVQRIEEPGVATSFDKPQGLYTTPANVKSPHTDLGGIKTEYGIKPNAKEVVVDVSGFSKTPMERGIDQMATNLVWLRQELPDVANGIRGKRFSELKTIFSKEFPKTEWNKYTEIQDMIEGYAGLKARQQGIDVIRGIDKTSPEFSEVVILNKNVLKTRAQLKAEWDRVVSKITERLEPIIQDPVKKLTEVLNKFKSLRGKQEASYVAERGARFGATEKVFSQKGGETGAKIAFSKMKGELSKVNLSGELKKELRDSVKQGAIDDIYNIIQGNKWMTTGEKLTGLNGLRKAFGGELPTEGELEVLETVLGRDFADSLRIAEPWKWTIWNVASEVGGTMKVLLSSMGDLSAFGRQLAHYVTRHPIKGIKLLKEGVVSGVSQKHYDNIAKQIVSHEYYPIAKRFSVPFTEVSKIGGKLNKADEQFLIRLFKRIPVVGNVVNATERAFNTMVNKARADWFYGLTDDLIKAGYDPIQNPNAFKRASDFVGSFTGRGNLGKVLNDATELMNFFIYSPRLIKSRIDIIASPITYLNAPAPLRKEVWKTLLSYYGTMGLILGGASLAGHEVETDSNSTDFLKIKKGDQRIDISGGLQPYYRFISQLLTSTRKVGAKEQKVERLNIIGSFLRGKASPLASFGIDIISGKNFLGEPITPSRLLYEHFTNLIIQDVIDASKEIGWLNALGVVAPLTFLGIGVQTYGRKPKKGSSGSLPGLKDKDLPGLPGSSKKLPKLPGL